MDDYNKELCEKTQSGFNDKFEVIFTRLDKLEGRINWFYILAISTLVTIIVNFAKDIMK